MPPKRKQELSPFEDCPDCGMHMRKKQHRNHLKICDGISREERDDGKLLCSKGCTGYFAKTIIRVHEKTCEGRPLTTKDGKWLCALGCNMLLPSPAATQLHHMICDGKKRIIREDSWLLCLNGCGAYVMPALIQRHEQTCLGLNENGFAVKAAPRLEEKLCRHGCSLPLWQLNRYKHEEMCKANHLLYAENPMNHYATYLDFCIENGLKLNGEKGLLPEILCQISLRFFSKSDFKAEEDVDYYAMENEEEADAANPPTEGECKLTLYAAARRLFLERNRALLDRLGNKDEEITGGKCTGFSWRHGFLPCQTIMTSQNTRVVEEGGKAALNFRCASCSILNENIRDFILRSKYRDDGVQLCSKTEECEGILYAAGQCVKHHQHEKEVRSLAAARRRIDVWNQRVEIKKGNTQKKSGWDIATSSDMALFLSRRPALPPLWEIVQKKMLSNKSSHNGINVFFIDCEFGQTKNGKTPLFEISVMDICGRMLLDTRIRYDSSLEEILNESRPFLRGYVRNIYGSTEDVTRGMTIKDLGIKLANIGINRDSLMIEWSTSGCDRRILCSNLESEPIYDILPNKDRWLRGISQLWQKIMPGCPSFALDLLYDMVFPDDTGRAHHRSGVDTEKLFKMVEKAMVSCKLAKKAMA